MSHAKYSSLRTSSLTDCSDKGLGDYISIMSPPTLDTGDGTMAGAKAPTLMENVVRSSWFSGGPRTQAHIRKLLAVVLWGAHATGKRRLEGSNSK